MQRSPRIDGTVLTARTLHAIIFPSLTSNLLFKIFFSGLLPSRRREI